MNITKLLVAVQFFSIVSIRGCRIRNLEWIIQEFSDSLVLIIKFSNSIHFDPINNVPVILYSLQESFTRKESKPVLKNTHRILSAFFLFPEPEKHSILYEIDWELRHYFYKDTSIYLNIFINPLYNTRDEGSLLASAIFSKQKFKSVSVYRLHNTSRRECLYDITHQFIALIIPHVAMELFEFESCLDANVSVCRSAIDRQSQLWHTNRVWSGGSDTQEILSFYLNDTLHPPFYRWNDLIALHFNNPFKKDESFMLDQRLDLLLKESNHWIKIDEETFRHFQDWQEPSHSLGLGDDACAMADLRSKLWQCITSSSMECHLHPTDATHMNFVTCDGVSQFTAFAFYFNPYDLYSWITFILFTIVILPFFVYMLYTSRTRVISIWKTEWILFFQTVFFNVSLT